VILSLTVIAVLALSSPVIAKGSYQVTPHDAGNAGPLVDMSGSDAVVPVWDAPIGTFIEYMVATAIAVICSGILAPIAGRIQDVLSHEKRKSIYKYILQNPGCTIADISANLSINIGTVYHHVWVLELKRKVFFEPYGKFVRIFEGRLASSEKKIDRMIYSHVRNEMSKKLLSAILVNPGINNVNLANIVGLDKSTIYWYLRRFRQDGLVVMVQEGRHKKCFVNDKVKTFLEESDIV
jgi:predicted transcriptional regulator